MKKGAGMGGWSTAGHGAARRAHFRDSGRGPLRWRVLFLAVLLPGAAWGEQTAHEMLKEMRDHSLWKDVGGCPGAERYLNAFPEGLHAGEARECLEAGQAERQVERLLEECEAHFAADRLRTGLGGNAVDCYGEVLSLDRGNRDALSGLDRVMEEYGRRVRQALEGGRLEMARGFLEKMAELNTESREVEELEDAIARAERQRMARRPGDRFRDCPECPEMVVVPGGKFGNSFAVGAYEVTFREWDACKSGGGCGGYRPSDKGWSRGRHPVINVNWNDAKAYVRWLSRKTGEEYRLLSEAEWEYVARAGTTTEYWWGNDIGRNRANCRGCGSRWDNRQTAPVGSFSANSFGLYDVHGNVWEWVEDCWEGDCRRRVLRGGSWSSEPFDLRSALRVRHTAGIRLISLGFRVARTQIAKLEEKPSPLSSQSLAATPEDNVPSAAPTPEEVEKGLRWSRGHRRLVEMGLAVAGHDPGPADGRFSEQTRAALRSWQHSNRMEVTGYLTKKQGDVLTARGREVSAGRSQRAEAERRQRAEAERLRHADDEEFARAKRLHTESGYREYLARGGRHETEARALLSEVMEAIADARGKKSGTTFRDCPECPEMVVVPAGSFMMGSSPSEADRYGDEGPRHRVTIARPFAVGVYEVTRGEYGRFVSATDRWTANSCVSYEDGKWKERSGRHWKSPGYSQTDSHPAVCMSLEDAQAYVRWLSRETGEEYRLLSESEWEYVARAKTTGRYHFGLRISPSQANYGRNRGKTAPVGSYSANAWGLYDVHGNVWEWVEDCWNVSYRGAPTDGRAWESGACGRRVLRGGSWYNEPRILRSAMRRGNSTGRRNGDVGFRVARTLTLESPERKCKERARVSREKTPFSELLGRSFSHECREDSAGWTDLHYAALLDLPGAVASLCDAGMAADTRLKDGPSPFDDDLKLTLAALGHEEEFKDWQAYGETPLMIAAVGKAHAAAAELVACGADVNAKGSTGWTALHFAARKNSLDVAKLLIERGADMHAKADDDWTALHVATWDNSLDVAKLLIERGADVRTNAADDWTTLHFVAWNNSLDMAKLLIERGADVNAKTQRGARPLHFAAWKNSLDVAKLLIERGADVNAKGSTGRTALHYAARKNSLDVAKLLIERDADIHAKADDDWTALHVATWDNSLDVAKLLIERGADVSSKDDDGDTPLDLALSKRDREEMQAVLRHHGGRCAKRC